MEKLKFGDIVLLKFPFSDGKTFKRRPALTISDHKDGDILVCRITSQIYQTKNDIFINDWEKAGLKLPSVIRVHKMATLENGLVESLMGKINNHSKSEVKKVISKLTE